MKTLSPPVSTLTSIAFLSISLYRSTLPIHYNFVERLANSFLNLRKLAHSKPMPGPNFS
jgi:hypothetical protein